MGKRRLIWSICTVIVALLLVIGLTKITAKEEGNGEEENGRPSCYSAQGVAKFWGKDKHGNYPTASAEWGRKYHVSVIGEICDGVVVGVCLADAPPTKPPIDRRWGSGFTPPEVFEGMP